MTDLFTPGIEKNKPAGQASLQNCFLLQCEVRDLETVTGCVAMRSKSQQTLSCRTCSVSDFQCSNANDFVVFSDKLGMFIPSLVCEYSKANFLQQSQF